MQVEIRSQLWRQKDWGELIASYARARMQESGEAITEVLALARLAEAALPDRRVAISLYQRAYQHEPKAGWMERARHLAQELGDFHLIAELAQLEYRQRPSVESLQLQALALLDAGAPQQAVAPLAGCVAQLPNDRSLSLLYKVAGGDFDGLPARIAELEREAEASVGSAKADLLLLAARLSRMLSKSEDTSLLLMRAFDAHPGNDSVFALLEHRWIEEGDWRRLSNLYRIRAEMASAKGRDAEVLRRAGIRLVGISASKGLGLRLLQEGVQAIYRLEVEEGSSLIAMLSLVIAELIDSGATASAVRLLAQALAHPRSDDEVMWIVNNGIALSEGTAVLERTTQTFKALRDRVLEQNPAMQSHAEEPLENDVLLTIDDELQEMTRPSGLAASIAERVDIPIDVQIAARAEIQIGAGSIDAMTRDLSSTGAFLACRTPLALGDELNFTMLLPGEDDWTLLEHRLSGVVVRVEAGVGVGIQFLDAPQEYIDNLNALHTSLVEGAWR